MSLTAFMGESGDRTNEILKAGIVGKVHIDSTNGIILEPENLLPPLNGESDDYDLSVGIPEVVGHIVNITPEGLPRRTALSRQNTEDIPLEVQSWVQEEEIVGGYRVSPTSDRQADPPGVTAVPSSTKAYPPGRYGHAFGYSQREKALRTPRGNPKRRRAKEREKERERGNPRSGKTGSGNPSGGGRRTPATGIVYFDLLAGQVPRVYVPDSHPLWATHLDIYLTKAGGIILFLQVSVPIEELESFVDVPGPLRTSVKATNKNTTGLPEPRRQAKGRNVRVANARTNLREGVYQTAPVYSMGGGTSLPARLSEKIVVVGEKKWVKTGTETVPVNSLVADAMASVLSGDAGASYTRITEPGGISDAQVRRDLGEAVYEAMARRAPGLRAGQGVSSNDAEVMADARASGSSGSGGPLGSSLARDEVGSEADATATNEPNQPLHQAEGKREASESPYVAAGGAYMGEEVDFEEDRLVSLINSRREVEGKPKLVLNRDLIRMAYRAVGGSKETPASDYSGATNQDRAQTNLDDADAALGGLADVYLDGWRAVGVAREPLEDGYVWCVVYGDTLIEGDGDEAMVCETIDPDGNTHIHGHDENGEHAYLGSIAPDGTRYTDASADAGSGPPQGWSCVRANQLHAMYSGSYFTSLRNAFSSWGGKSAVDVDIGDTYPSPDVRISDASLPSGVYGRTYSDHRMYGSSYYLSVGTGNANQAMWCHETGHALGLPHNSGQSVMRASINPSSSSNIATPQSADVNAVVGAWGAAGSGGGTGGGGGGETGGGTGGGGETGGSPGNGGGGGTEEPETVEKPVYELVNTGYRSNKCLQIDVPPPMRGNLNPSLRWIPYVYYEPLSVDEEGGTGGRTSYRLYPANQTAASAFNNTGRHKRHVEWSGFPPESAPRGESVRSVQEDPPTENTTQVASPDPTTIPDKPGVSGKRRPAAGGYLVSINARYADGTISRESEPESITIGLNEMMKVTFPQTVNLIPNANVSQVDASGVPTGCVGTNLAVSTNTVDTSVAGVLKIDAASTTASAPAITFPLVPVDSETPLHVAGKVALERQTTGKAVVTLRQYDSAGTYINADIPCAGMNALGELPFSATHAGASRHPDCSFVAVRLALVSTGSGANGRAALSNLRGFAFASDLRQFAPGEEGEEGEMDSFDAGPEEGYPRGSFVAVGVPPAPAGGEVEEAEPPEAHHSFADTTLPTGLTEYSTGSATGGITTTSPIYGTRSHRSLDASNSLRSYRRIGYDLMHSGKSSRERVAHRALYRFDQLPSVGQRNKPCYLHDVVDTSGNPLARMKLHQSGRLDLEITSSGRTATHAVSYGISAGGVFDLEVIFVGGTDGFVSIGLGLGGEPRRIALTRAANFGSRRARHVFFGVTGEEDVKVMLDCYSDEYVVTEGGDVPKRERPPVPPAYTPLPPDRPELSSGIYREQTPPDRNGQTELSPQVYAFVKPGDVDEESPAVVDILREPLFVWPGETYTLALFRRWVVFSGALPGFRVRLSGDGLADMVLTSQDGLSGALAEPMAGMRGWHATRASGTAYEDDYLTFTVPEPVEEEGENGETLAYTEAQVEAVMLPGILVWQDHLLARGELATFAEREAKRTLKHAEEATITTVLDARPPGYEHGLPAAGLRYSGFGVTHDLTEPLEDGTEPASLEALYSTSPDRLTYSIPSYDPEDIALLEAGGAVEPRTPERFLRMETTMRGDGWATPRIAAGGIHLRTWTHIGQLLRVDSTPFPGGAWVGNLLVEENLPETTYGKVAGHVIRVRESEDVGRVGPVTVVVFTEEAYQEVSLITRTEDVRLEVPTAGGEASGRAWYARPASAVEWDMPDFPVGVRQAIEERAHRQIYAIGTIEEMEILESMPLSGAISPPLRVGAEMVR